MSDNPATPSAPTPAPQPAPTPAPAPAAPKTYTCRSCGGPARLSQGDLQCNSEMCHARHPYTY